MAAAATNSSRCNHGRGGVLGVQILRRIADTSPETIGCTDYGLFAAAIASSFAFLRRRGERFSIVRLGPTPPRPAVVFAVLMVVTKI